jgi:ABC-type amino acid transport system permease subunit
VRNLTRLVATTIVGLVIWAIANAALGHWLDLSPALGSTIPVAIASFLAGMVLGGRLETASPDRWGIALGCIFAVLLLLPSFFVSPSAFPDGTPPPVRGIEGVQLRIAVWIPFLLALVGPIFGVRASAKRVGG